MLLAQCKKQSTVEVTKIHSNALDPQLGVFEGQKIKVLANRMNSQMLIELLGNRYGLSKQAAAQVEVKIISE